MSGVFETLPVELTDISGEDRDFFRAIAMYEGEATTSDIRGTSGLKRSQVHYRIDKFEELGLIVVDRTGDSPRENEPNTVRLTDDGRDLVDSGALEEINDANATLESVSRQLDHLEQRIDTIEDHVSTSQWQPLTDDQRDAVNQIVRQALQYEDRRDLLDEVERLSHELERLKAETGEDVESTPNKKQTLKRYLSRFNVPIREVDRYIDGSGEVLNQRRAAILECLKIAEERGEVKRTQLQEELYDEHPAGYETKREGGDGVVSDQFSMIARESDEWEFEYVLGKIRYLPAHTSDE